MGVESGPSGATGAISAAPSGISLGNGLEFGPALGIVDIGPIVNEGPAGLIGLENTMPYKLGSFDPTGEIVFNPVASAAWEPLVAPIPVQPEFAEVPAVFQLGLADINLDPVPQAEPWIAPIAIPNGLEYATPRVAISPALKPANQVVDILSIQPGRMLRSESGVSTVIAQSTAVQPVLQEEIEVVEEKKSVVEEDKTGVKNSEQLSENRIKLVEAVEISKKRKGEIIAAIRKLGGKGVLGKLITKLLSADFWQSKSPIARDSKDWTIDLTARAIESDTTDYKSEEEAEKALVKSVEENIPVKVGEEGRQATYQEVKKVISGNDQEIIRGTRLE